jgi:hypothetical protein
MSGQGRDVVSIDRQENADQSLPSRYTWTVPTLLASMDCAGKRDDKRNAAAIRRDGIMEDLLCGWWLVRLSTALIDVILPKDRNDLRDRSFHAANAP